LVYDPLGEELERYIAGSVLPVVERISEHVTVAGKGFFGRKRFVVFVDDDPILQGYRAQIDAIAKDAYATARKCAQR
jgi:hypothetical protein